MSPEQAELNQLDIDTRCDISALGVMLYELLAGQHADPHERLKTEAVLETLRCIREEEPRDPACGSAPPRSSRRLPPTAGSTRNDWGVCCAVNSTGS
jgi:hypothetical protein